jgi:hypothetical protein
MISSDVVPNHAVGLIKHAAAPGVVTVPEHTVAATAANDDAAAADPMRDQNVLWIMAIALGVFCGFTAFVIAVG